MSWDHLSTSRPDVELIPTGCIHKMALKDIRGWKHWLIKRVDMFSGCNLDESPPTEVHAWLAPVMRFFFFVRLRGRTTWARWFSSLRGVCKNSWIASWRPRLGRFCDVPSEDTTWPRHVYGSFMGCSLCKRLDRCLGRIRVSCLNAVIRNCLDVTWSFEVQDQPPKAFSRCNVAGIWTGNRWS